MSLLFSYDFGKHTMITFAIITTVLIIGLIMLVGKVSAITLTPMDELRIQKLINDLSGGKFYEFKKIINYCYEHADNPNPVQDLVNQGLVSSKYSGATCASVKQAHDNLINITMNIIERQGTE